MMNIRKIIREELRKSLVFYTFTKKENKMISEGYVTNNSSYEFGPFEIWSKIDELKSIGKSLDLNYPENVEKIQIISTGERSGRSLVEVKYPDETIVLFYKSSKGTSGKEKGGWFPIPGFLNSPAPGLGLKVGWFIKTNGVDSRYGIKTFQGTADYLKDNESDLQEIDLHVNSNQGAKPGIVRQFPEKEEGGNSLNLNSSGGPNEFPEEKDLK